MLWTSRQATGLASRAAWVPGWIPFMNTSWSLTSFLEKRKTWRCLMLHIRASRATCEEGVCPWWRVYCHTVCSIPAQLCFICLFHFYCVFYCFWRGLCVLWHTHGGLRDDLQELVLYCGSQWNLAVQAWWQTSSSLKPSHCLLQYFKFWGWSVTG